MKEIVISLNGARTRIRAVVEGESRRRSQFILTTDPAIGMVRDAANRGFEAGYDAAIDRIACG